MTDRRLRELERRWHEAGTLEAEAAYLRGAARAGELPGGLAPLVLFEHPAAVLAATGQLPLRVRRRAFFEHVIETYETTDPPIAKAVRRYMRRVKHPSWASRHSPRALLSGLHEVGRFPSLRAAAVPARRLIVLAPPAIVDQLTCIPAAIDAWLDCPCPRHRRDLKRLLHATPLPPGVPTDGLAACRKLARAFAATGVQWRRPTLLLLRHCDRLSNPSVSKEIRERLLPWALGREALQAH